MTEGPPHHQSAIVELPPSGTGERSRNRVRRQRERRVQQTRVIAAMVILAAAIPMLGYVGFKKVFNTTEGRSVGAQNDPTRPNYEANVVPTPVLLFAQTSSDGLTGLTMLSLGGGDTGGGVLFIPVTTVTNELDKTSTTTSTTSASTTTTTKPSAGKTTTLAAAYAANGAGDVNQLTANVVGVSFDQFVVMTDEQLAAFVAPATPLTI